MNLNVFIAHSNKFMGLTLWFADFLINRGLRPIIVEQEPNYGHLWTIPEKIDYFFDRCETALVITTPDEIQDGVPIPRMDINVEMGRLKETQKKTIVLKEENTKLPTGLSPVYISFNLDNPQDSLEKLDKELISIFGDIINTEKPFKKSLPEHIREPDLNIEGKQLIPERELQIQHWNDEYVQGFILNNLYLKRYFFTTENKSGRYIPIKNIMRGLPPKFKGLIKRNIIRLRKNNLIYYSHKREIVSAILDRDTFKQGLELCNKYRRSVDLPELDERLNEKVSKLRGLVLFHTFSAGVGNRVWDRSAFGNNGTIVGCPMWVPSVHQSFGTAIEFVSSNQNSLRFDKPISNKARTIAFWVNLDTENEKIMALNNNAYIEVINGELSTKGLNGAPTFYVQGAKSTHVPASLWVHVALISDADEDVSDLVIGEVGGKHYNFKLDELYIDERSLINREVRTLAERRGKM